LTQNPKIEVSTPAAVGTSRKKIAGKNLRPVEKMAVA
jgi:hypothetical protein